MMKMTPAKYRDHLKRLGLSIVGAAPLPGISRRHSQRIAGEKSFEPCCKDMKTAMSVPAGRHFFVEDGVLKLTVAKTPLEGGGEGILEHPVRFCPFCGKPAQARSEDTVGPWTRR